MRTLLTGHLVAASVLLVGTFARAQTPAAPAPPGTVANADRTITFRLTSPGAERVSVLTDGNLDRAIEPLAMVRQGGVWTATTPPLPPERYGYTFVVDGVHLLDPLNRDVHPNFQDLYSDVLVPGQPPAPWELTALPHGAVTHHTFTTRVALHYPGDQTGYVVYTPPGYDPRRPGGYPVLYLLHGYTDTEEGWTRTGRADLMLDRLLADGKIVPMVVVMPRGYGDFDIVAHGRGGTTRPGAWDRNVDLFCQSLIAEILPAVERQYNVGHDRASRAIAGLSMGGQESLAAGLAHPDLFAYVAGLSAGLAQGADFDALFPHVDAARADLRLLWIACGTADSLLKPNRALVAWAHRKGLPVTAVETPGGHAFPVWRDNLLTLAPLLFR